MYSNAQSYAAVTPTCDLLLSEASLACPTWMSTSNWHEHAPFIFWLIESFQPRTVVELGDTVGPSYLTLCQAVQNFAAGAHCLAVAPAQRTTADDSQTFIALHDEAGYDHFSSFIQSAPESALQQFADGTIDLLSISPKIGVDSATYLEQWLDKMSTQGLLLLHGTEDLDRYPAVAHIHALLTSRYPSFQFRHAGGLTVMGVGAARPDAFRRGYGLSPDEWHAVQAFYARLGESVSLSFSHNIQGETIRKLQRALKAKAKAQTQLEEQLAGTSKLVQNLRTELARAEGTVQALLHSTSWRLSAPVRAVGRRLNTLRINPRQVRSATSVVLHSLRSVGIVETSRKIRRRLSDISDIGNIRTAVARHIDITKMPRPSKLASELLAPRIVLVAETSLPQCLKYRVLQKQEMFRSLGVDSTVVRWSDYEACYEALQTHSIAIFYRVPGYPEVLDVISAAKTLGVKTFWEVDDLIFDISKYTANKNLNHLTPELRREVLSGVPLYLRALLACDGGIASTTGLAEAMREVGMADVHVIENGFDEETLTLARRLTSSSSGPEALPASDGQRVRIVYGSGSKAHDADFLEAAQALLEVLQRFSFVELHVAGELTLPASFAAVSSQVFREPALPYPAYMKWLSRGDINIAPMEDSSFNDAKSNIKYLEAAALRIPSVCSPCAAFSSAISNGRNGYLAKGIEQWITSLSKLVENPQLRRDLGEAAWKHALDYYSTDSVARAQVAPFVERFKCPPPRISILGVNVFYAPRSFGGATIIAEEMAKRLCKVEGVRYSMFTTASVDAVPAYKTTRYESEGVTVFGIGLPTHLPRGLDFENHEMHEPFRQVLRATRPDIVHVHCVQGIGATIIDICKEEKIPVAVTLHDAWWICARQFMVTGDNRYCNQVTIDLDVCAKCLRDDGSNLYRQSKLGGTLQSADLLLTPSKFFRDLYVANGFDAAKIVVNKNGVLKPLAPRVENAVHVSSGIRFGFLGGVGPIKGYNIIKSVFSSLERDDYELVLVDNALNLGITSIRAHEWKIGGMLKIIPAFTQETIDDFFRSIDVLLFPTQWKESFGLAVREALVRDVWVIATDGGGVVEDITPGVNGDVIPLTDDGTALKRSILAVLNDKMRFKNYKNPHANDIRLFDSQAKELLELLEQTVAHVGAESELADVEMLDEESDK